MNFRTTLLLLIVLFLTPCFLNAQKAPIKFGKLSPEEIEMKYYEKDTSAVAVILCDYGRSYYQYEDIQGRFIIIFERHTKIKIFKKEGLDHANVEIPLRVFSHSAKDEIGTLKAFTYNFNGKDVEKVKLDDDAVFLENVHKYKNLKKFTMPNVKEGSIIEYKYTVRSPYKMRNWQFQHMIPTLYSEYRVTIPEYYNFKENSKGYEPFSLVKNETKSEQIEMKYKTESQYGFAGVQRKTQHSTLRYISNFKQWIAKDMPAFKEEPYMTTAKNFLTSIEFELNFIKYPNSPVENFTTSWEEINKDLLNEEDFGVQLKRSGFLKDIIEQINANTTTTAEKIATAFKFVQGHMSHNDYISIYTTASLRKAYNEKEGNVSDINLMLTTLLNELGVEANPVILSTREYGIINPFFPSRSNFNYVIACVMLDGKELLLDASIKKLPVGLLPTKCLNGKGRLISEKGTRWVDLKPKQLISRKIFDLSLNEEGILSGNFKAIENGYSGWFFRNNMKNKTDEEIIESLVEDNEGLAIEEIEVTDFNETDKPVSYKCSVEIENKAEAINDLIYINPMLFEQEDKNPFKLEDRKYPVDFGYPQTNTCITVINIPEGYVVESLPKNTGMALPNKRGLLRYSISQSGQKIQMICTTKLEAVYQYNEYAGLKEFYNKLVAKQAEMIVLKKQ